MLLVLDIYFCAIKLYRVQFSFEIKDEARSNLLTLNMYKDLAYGTH